MFFGDTDFALFFGIFFINFENMKKVKSAQTIAPVDEFKGSPGWKKHTLPWKNTSMFASKFHEKSMKIEPQSEQNHTGDKMAAELNQQDWRFPVSFVKIFLKKT